MSDVVAYTVSPGDAHRDQDLMHALWQENLATGDHMARKFSWFYLECPYGKPMIERLYHGATEAWVGVCSMGRRRMMWQGRPIQTGVLVDLAVLASHRSLGPALMMQQALVDHAKHEVDLILGFPNPKAAAVFKRIRYSKFSDIHRYGKVLRHFSYVRARVPAALAQPAAMLLDFAAWLRNRIQLLRHNGLVAEWATHAVDDMDDLWARSDVGDTLVAVRDATFLRWRFDTSPLFESRYLLIKDRKGTLLAWFATRQQDGVLHVMDFWSTCTLSGMRAGYINLLVAAARRIGCTSISMQAASRPHRMHGWITTGFIKRQSRPVFGYWSAPPNIVDSTIDLHLTVADEDE